MSHYTNLMSGLLGCPQWVLQDLDQTLLDKYVKQAKADDAQERIQESRRGVYEHLVILNHLVDMGTWTTLECFFDLGWVHETPDTISSSILHAHGY